MKFLNFAENRKDPFLHMKLTDLARTLSQNADLDVKFAFHSYYKKEDNKITISHYWNDILDKEREDGMKSDVYLRAFGNVHFTDYAAVSSFLHSITDSKHPFFGKQVFAILEDLRIERISLEHRPGMNHAFQERKKFLQKHFRERFSTHQSKEERLDALFCAIYLQMKEKPVFLSGELSSFKPFLRILGQELQKAEHTSDIKKITVKFLNEIEDNVQDMKASYFTIQEDSDIRSPEVNADEIVKELPVGTKKEISEKEDKEVHDEQLPTWHEEQEHDGDNFMQYDLEEGSATDLIGEGERKEESGDQAFISVQGASMQSTGTNFEGNEANESGNDSKVSAAEQDEFGEANRNAVDRKQKPTRPTQEHLQAYRIAKSAVQSIRKPLQQSIQKTIEQKQIAPRNDLHYGRLGKKILRVVTDENPRLFYKKNAPSKKLNATFSLLVDCSASMFNKMNETKEGIVLFHETLKALQIKHTITGFWEDAFEADEKQQPNYFFEVISHDSSLLPDSGPSIMQLEPEEDNRDGYAIRKAARKLLEKPEKHKILLVFTDGEPSAFDYSENGIVDTYEAVLKVRKKGIEVIGVFLASGEPQEKEIETMQNIYGRNSLVIPTVEDIPAYITPLLKRLLLRFV
ncbi:vWA domain-containing protein [Pseudalkalibacillus caeni]|uniref:vWA domain-containing protein n=1 Tax=Exobacillus caeni TaxID=2574798 RepID=UPI001485404C|nr:hypothetical protein [Pseudalkalibacillus caeni]